MREKIDEMIKSKNKNGARTLKGQKMLAEKKQQDKMAKWIQI
jgi:hypothetical protein